MGTPFPAAITVAATGVLITTSGTSAEAAIPNDAAGVRARLVRVSASVAACVRLGTTSSVAAVTTDLLVQPGEPVLLYCKGYGFIAAIQLAAAGKVQVSPVEM